MYSTLYTSTSTYSVIVGLESVNAKQSSSTVASHHVLVLHHYYPTHLSQAAVEEVVSVP
jgi:hypothetical protein